MTQEYLIKIIHLLEEISKKLYTSPEEKEIDSKITYTATTSSEDFGEADTCISDYAKQAMENHTIKIEDNFWMVVRQKPKWMPSFIYRAVIKQLVEFVQVK